jgi:type I restriction enzyme M protein
MFLIGDGHVLIKETNDSLLSLGENTYDYILTNPPYGTYKGDADTSKFKFAQKSRMEMLFLEKIVNALKPGCVGAAIIPDGVLENTSYSDYRLNLLSKVEIESIISLHEYVFRPYTSEKTYVLIFRKKLIDDNKIQKDPIWMYIVENDGYQKGDKRYEILENDLPDLIDNYKSDNAKGRCRYVEMSEINEDNFYNLLVEYYLPKDEEKVRIVSPEEFDNIINEQSIFINKLKDLINEIR